MGIKLILRSWILVGLAAASAAAASPDVRSLAQAVDAHYNHLRTLEAQFVETYRGNGTNRTESGTLWLKKPGKMRWEYRSPRQKLFLGDGKDAWFYIPGDRQVRRTSMHKLDDLRSPLSLLLGKTKLENELQGLSLAPDASSTEPGNVVLQGVPKRLGNQIAQVSLEITPSHQIARITIEEVDGSVTEYRFSDQREDLPVPDDRFSFSPPAGVEVIEGTLDQ